METVTITLQNGRTYVCTPDGHTSHDGKPAKIRAFARTKTQRAQNAHEIWWEDIEHADFLGTVKGRYVLIQEMHGNWGMFTYTSRVTGVSVALEGAAHDSIEGV